MPELEQPQLDLDSIEFAFNKLDDFALVHADKTAIEKVAPVTLLFESIGLQREQLLLVTSKLKGMGADAHAESAFFLGLIIGLLIKQWYE